MTSAASPWQMTWCTSNEQQPLRAREQGATSREQWVEKRRECVFPAILPAFFPPPGKVCFLSLPLKSNWCPCWLRIVSIFFIQRHQEQEPGTWVHYSSLCQLSLALFSTVCFHPFVNNLILWSDTYANHWWELWWWLSSLDGLCWENARRTLTDTSPPTWPQSGLPFFLTFCQLPALCFLSHCLPQYSCSNMLWTQQKYCQS